MKSACRVFPRQNNSRRFASWQYAFRNCRCNNVLLLFSDFIISHHQRLRFSLRLPCLADKTISVITFLCRQLSLPKISHLVALPCLRLPLSLPCLHLVLFVNQSWTTGVPNTESFTANGLITMSWTSTVVLAGALFSCAVPTEIAREQTGFLSSDPSMPIRQLFLHLFSNVLRHK